MKRFRRIIFNALTVLSLLMCVGTSAIWAYSYMKPFGVKVHIHDLRGGRDLYSANGEFFWMYTGDGYLQSGSNFPMLYPNGVYHYMLVLPSAIMPVLYLARRPKRKPRRGHCPVCNYDLRATPDRCPECGTIPAKVNA